MIKLVKFALFDVRFRKRKMQRKSGWSPGFLSVVVSRTEHNMGFSEAICVCNCCVHESAFCVLQPTVYSAYQGHSQDLLRGIVKIGLFTRGGVKLKIWTLCHKSGNKLVISSLKLPICSGLFVGKEPTALHTIKINCCS